MTAAVAHNWFATIALLLWPMIALALYRARPVNEATIWTILGGYLLLPVGASIKLAESIPQLDKVSIPALSALAGCFFFSKHRLRFWNGFGLAEVLLLIVLVGPLVTSELNLDTVLSGSVLLPGVGVYDGLSAIFGQFLSLIPFFLGRQFVRNSAHFEIMLRILVVSALLYSAPILFEIRMSPQLHLWFYGYYPHQFAQQLRDGGFRPMVFIGHGLTVAFFMMTATVAAAVLWRTRTRVTRLAPASIVGYLSVILILCKSLAALAYGAAAVPLVRWTSPRLQFRVAKAIVVIALVYPLLRAEDFVPTNYMVAAANFISAGRAASLEFRFDHEQQLLDRASQRLWFGWGRFGRSRIYDEWGQDISVSDGRWVITIGEFGLLGFVAEFGLLAWTIFRAARALRFAEAESAPDGLFLAAIALIVAITVIDQLPNSTLTPLTWLFAGALLGRAESSKKTAGQLSPRYTPSAFSRPSEGAQGADFVRN